jgi:hypothetical protein
MVYRPKTGVQTFNTDWNQTIAWASSQGIDAAAYMPVYQLDLGRLQNGQYPMGRVERNMAILAAHNPNQVSSVPSDNPRPTNVLGNAVSDVGKIATGIAGIFTGSFEHQIWDSAKATLHGIEDPNSLRGPSLGATIANWTNKTLLGFLPGVADIGALAQGGPARLAEHPLLSILDVMPIADETAGVTAGILRGETLGGAMAAQRGLTGYTIRMITGKDLVDSFGKRLSPKSGFSQLVSQAGSYAPKGRFAKAGVTMGGRLKNRLSVGDRVQNMMGQLGPGGYLGVGPAISSLGEALITSGGMQMENYRWLFAGPTETIKELSKTEEGRGTIATVSKMLSTVKDSHGDTYREMMADPAVSPAAKDLARQWMNGPLRFAAEEEVFNRNLRPMYGADGTLSMWSATGRNASKVFKAMRLRNNALRMVIDPDHGLPGLEHHTAAIEALQGRLAAGARSFHGQLVTARQVAYKDPAMQVPITRDLGRTSFARRKASLSRMEQLKAVIGQGGVADDFETALQRGDPEEIQYVAEALMHRLSGWGVKSVDAAGRPELQALYVAAYDARRWSHDYRAEARAIEETVYGEKAAQEHFAAETRAYHDEQTAVQKTRHKEQRDALLARYGAGKAKRAGDLAQRVLGIKTGLQHQIEIYDGQLTVARETGSDKTYAEALRLFKRNVRDANRTAAAFIKRARTKMEDDNKLAWTEYERDRSRLARDHDTERKTLTLQHRTVQEGMGGLLKEVRTYAKAIRGFHQAVIDFPADNFRDPFMHIYARRLGELGEDSAIKAASFEFIEGMRGMSQKAQRNLYSDPLLLGEYIRTRWHDIYRQPDLDPELAKDAADEMRQLQEDSMNELRLLIGQGFHVPYIPTAGPYDERLGESSFTPLIGRGIPKPDMAKEKVWDFTARKDDWVVGINKAAVQTLQRDAIIHMIENHLRPLLVTRSQLADFLDPKVLGEKVVGTTIKYDYATKAADLGLKVFNPDSLFGIRMPRWGADEMYLPAALVDALERFNKQRVSILAKPTKVFRYSILGLSPRYTAHVVFGGSMMLALRSTPYMPAMIGRAAKALRDGTVPHEILRREAEQGFVAPGTLEDFRGQAALDAFGRAAGRDMVNMAVGEHIEVVQGIKAAAATPIHALRALADINFRFVRYVRDLQASLAYFDAAAKYERRFGGKVSVEHPETGQLVEVSPDRAVKEGIHHVEQVYGNLNRMSPFERSVAQSVMPFYGWQKHILGYVFSFPFDHPYRAMILSQLAFNSSQRVPLADPIRLQFLMFLGAPDKFGNTTAIDLRSLDPFRDVANYATQTGFFESLNPALEAPLAMAFGPQAVYGESSLYPNVTYNAFYGIRTAAPGGNLITAAEQFVPQIGALQSALQSATGARSLWQTNRPAAIKTLLQALNIPFVTPPVNLPQLAARGGAARFETAKADAQTAFSTGDFSRLRGYTTVPYPLNPAYQVTPAQLQRIYNQALQATPGVAPTESLLPPRTPPGW